MKPDTGWRNADNEPVEANGTPRPSRDPSDWCAECGHLVDVHDLRGDEACTVDGCTCGTITAAAIINAVHAAYPGLPAVCGMTGGWTATVQVGVPMDGRYPVLIGPGSYDARDAAASTFALADLYAGPDDDGETEPTAVHSAADITAYIAAVARGEA